MQKQDAVILLAELAGFRSMIEDLPSAEVDRLVNAVHTLFDTSVRLHQGAINRFTGDTLLAVFNSQEKRSPAEVHAVNAAYELKEALPSSLPGQDISLRMAITSGQVLFTTFGSGQTNLMGDPLSHADRICRFAGDNQLLVDKAVYEASLEHCEYQALEPIPLKSGTEALAIYESLKKKRKKLDLKAGNERKIGSEMVGRDKEFDTVHARIRELLKGKGSIINIIGKAGMGKSRLMAEIKTQPDMEKVALFEGRGSSTGSNSSFHPVIQILKSWIGMGEEDSSDESGEKLYQAINQVAPDELDEIFPFIATMLGLPLKDKAAERIKGIEEEALEKLILKNLRDLLIKAAGKRPVLIVLEDLHWADASSINFLKTLYKLANDHPVLFINILRPGYEKTGEYIVRFIEDNFTANHSQVFIGSLLEEESVELMENLLQKVRLPEKVNAMILKKSEGNPFFIEEIIRSFIDEEIILFENNTYRITDKIDRASIPETINEVILSRVDKLDEKTKELLTTASVIGRNFYFKVLEKAADTIGELEERLQYLKDVQLINDGDRKGEIEYLFKHALAQQATYDSILTGRRKELHLKIARSIEKVFAGNLKDFYGTLATHYEQAEDPEKTEEYLIKAGNASLQKGASAEAITFFRNALKHYTFNHTGKIDNKKVAEIEENLAISLFVNGRQKECVHYFEKVQAFYGLRFPKKKPAKIVRTLVNLINLFWLVRFSNEKRKREANETEKKLEKIYITKGHALISFDGKRMFFEYLNIVRMLNRTKISSLRYGIGNLVNLSALFVWTGIAHKLGHAIFRLAQSNLGNEDDYSWMQVSFQREVNTYFSGNTGDPHPVDHQVYERGMAIGEFWQTLIYYSFNCLIQTEKGNKVLVDKCLDFIQKVGDAFDNSLCSAQDYRCRSNYLLRTREIDKLIDLTARGVEDVSKTDHEGMLLMIFCARSIGFSLRGELIKARENLDKADEIFKKFSIKLYESHCLIARSFLEKAMLEKTTDEEEKGKLLGRHLKTSKKLVKTAKKVLPHLAEAYRLQANACILNKQYTNAQRSFRKAIEAADRFGTRLELSRVYFDTGRFLSGPGSKYRDLNGHPAGHYLEQAKIMFEEMDLRWDLAEYKRSNSGKQHSNSA